MKLRIANKVFDLANFHKRVGSLKKVVILKKANIQINPVLEKWLITRINLDLGEEKRLLIC
jgi:hypothetical protein